MADRDSVEAPSPSDNFPLPWAPTGTRRAAWRAAVEASSLSPAMRRQLLTLLLFVDEEVGAVVVTPPHFVEASGLDAADVDREWFAMFETGFAERIGTDCAYRRGIAMKLVFPREPASAPVPGWFDRMLLAPIDEDARRALAELYTRDVGLARELFELLEAGIVEVEGVRVAIAGSHAHAF